jgi:hypothetical protein
LVLLIVYQLSLAFIPDSLRLTQWGQRGNYRVAETYLYSRAQSGVGVVVGTSLAQAIPETAMDPDLYNLAFGAGCAQTGLEFVERSGARPRLVLIEMNYFAKKIDPEFVANLFQPGLSQLRRHFSMFREINRPANYVAGLTQWSIDLARAAVHHSLGRPESVPAPATGPTTTKVTQEILALRLQEYNQSPRRDLLRDAAYSIAASIKVLEARGCTVVLFEMPVDPVLRDATFAREMRAAAHTFFPAGQFNWIPTDPAQEYLTRDGVHLEPFSARKFGLYLVEQSRRFPTHHPEPYTVQ